MREGVSWVVLALWVLVFPIVVTVLVERRVPRRFPPNAASASTLPLWRKLLSAMVGLGAGLWTGWGVMLVFLEAGSLLTLGVPVAVAVICCWVMDATCLRNLARGLLLGSCSLLGLAVFATYFDSHLMRGLSDVPITSLLALAVITITAAGCHRYSM